MNKKIILLSFIFICIVIIQNKLYAEGKKMNIFENQPVFTIKVDSFATKHVVNINGMHILRDYDEDGKSSASFPANHLIRNGTNIIELNVFPPKSNETINKNSSVTIQLNVHSKDTPDDIHVLSSIIFTGGDIDYISTSSQSGEFNLGDNLTAANNGAIIISNIETQPSQDYEGGLNFTRSIKLPAPFPLWGFFESDKLPNYDAMSDEEYYNNIQTLLNEYLIIQDAVTNKRFDALSSLLSERNQEFDAAFYNPSGTAHNKLISSLREAADDKDLELVGLEKNNVNFSVEDNNKVASLVRDGRTPAVALRFKSGNGTQSYPFMFRYKNKKWILTR